MGRALICGYYGHYNLGDEAMLSGMLHQLHQWQPGLACTVYSNHPTDTTWRHGVATLAQTPINRRRARWRRRFDTAWAMLQNRYFVVGGGDLLRDGTQKSVAEVWLAPLQQAIRLRCRPVVWGVSVGKIWRPETKQRIRQVLNQTELIGVRDGESAEALRSLGVRRPIWVGPDLALLRPIPIIPRTPGNRPRIGVSFRAIANRHPLAAADIIQVNFDQLQRSMAACLDWLVDTYDAEIHLIPFQSFPDAYRQHRRSTVDDYSSTQTMLQSCRYAERMQLYHHVPDLEQLDGILASLDLMIGMRLHSLILAARVGVPGLAIEYDPKVKRFMAEVGQCRNSIPLKDFTLETGTSKITQLLGDTDSARQSVQAGLAQYRQAGTAAMAAFEDFWRV